MGVAHLRMLRSPVGAEVVIEGARYINFGGSSYLGLTAVPEILDAGVTALRSYGSGYQFIRDSGIVGEPHQQAEAEIAAFFGTQAGLYMAAGYYFGLIGIAALRSKVNAIFYDEWAHHCLREGVAASRCPSYMFRHLDAGDLDSKLKQHLRANDRPLVVTDGLYSTFGEIAPLSELARTIRPYGGYLLIDESHSFGVLGELGRGAAEHHGIFGPDVHIGGSTGKGLGVLGGMIPATAEEVASFRMTPAGRGAAVGLPAAAAMCARSLRYVREHPEIRSRLHANVAYVKSSLRRLGLDVAPGVAPVAAFAAGTDQDMRVLQARLMSERIFVFHSTYIGAGSSGVIRVAVFADHTMEHIDRLCDALSRML